MDGDYPISVRVAEVAKEYGVVEEAVAEVEDVVVVEEKIVEDAHSGEMLVAWTDVERRGCMVGTAVEVVRVETAAVGLGTGTGDAEVVAQDEVH